MGYYVEVPAAHGKAALIAKTYDGAVVDYAEADKAMDNPDMGVIVAVNNGLFEAAGFAHSRREFDAFTMTDDPRPRQFVILDRDVAEKASGFKT